MGCLDVDVLKKHGLNANHVKNDPLFFFTLLFPIRPPARIEGDKCISVNGVNGDTRMPYFSTLAQFINVYASMNDSGSGMGHEWNPTSTTKIPKKNQHFVTTEEVIHGYMDRLIKYLLSIVC